MGSQQKDIELSPVKAEIAPKKEISEAVTSREDDEEDIIIGRFRKISSAKSMAATNGNIQYPTDLPKPEIDIEAGLQFKTRKDNETLLEKSNHVPRTRKTPVTKSSFRDIEKPSRFKDQPSTTRFQVCICIIVSLYYDLLLLICFIFIHNHKNTNNTEVYFNIPIVMCL